jgi:methyl-accepting chemotaxis protein
VRIAEGAGELLAKLVPDIRKTAELVREIAAASAEQSTGALQVNKAMLQLDQVIQQNSSASEEMAAASSELASQAEIMQSAVRFFRLDSNSRSEMAEPVMFRSVARPRRPAVTTVRSAAPELASMNRAIKSAGAQINLDSNTGHADSHDSEFAPFSQN